MTFLILRFPIIFGIIYFTQWIIQRSQFQTHSNAFIIHWLLFESTAEILDSQITDSTRVLLLVTVQSLKNDYQQIQHMLERVDADRNMPYIALKEEMLLTTCQNLHHSLKHNQ